ncbi:MAG: BamA/TamA family outer membrane protein [Bacteroidetes bacterium]|nr:BamA/TamA family outer membrane protein [Bacteroidota bacterium]
MVPEGQYLLQSNKVKGTYLSASNSEILSQVKLQPNRRIFLIKTHLIAHKIGESVGLEKIGEKPVLVDTAAIIASASNIQRYLFKKGYFNNTVSYEIHQGRFAKFMGQRKLKVTYLVNEGKGYFVDKLNYKTDNYEIRRILENNREKSLVKEGGHLDYNLISDERTRITTMLKNSGYYFFNASYIDIVIDSAKGNFKGDVEFQILNPKSGEHIHQNIYSVTTEIISGEQVNDSIVDQQSGLVFKLNGTDMNTQVLSRNILIRPGQLYSQQKLQSTYARLAALDIYETLTIQSKVHEGDSGRLDVLIQLRPAPRFDLTWQPQFITTDQRFNQSQSSRNAGIANELSLKNKNAFNNGEELSINVRTALETQITRDSNSAFSTFIQEVNTELKIPQLLFLPNLNKSDRFKSVSTQFNASYLYENNPYYRRNLFPLSYTYRFEMDRSLLYVSPLLISLNKAVYKPYLVEKASETYVQTLDRLFTNNLITSWRIGGVYTSRVSPSGEYFQLNSNLLEVAGMFLPQFTDYGNKLDVHHSTFVRTDLDFKYYLKFSDDHQLVFRSYTGIGVPIGDRSVLPYERRFFAGGTNYLRGWRLRTVGPGSFTTGNNLQFTRSGELSLIGNVEYRFNIFRGAIDLNGAVFGDVGNVWNLKADTLFPGGEININRFYNEFAVNGGLGLRADFQFLILRFDWGVPVWDPNKDLENRLVIAGAFKDKWLFRRPVWNVAVGYPF